MTHKPFVPPSMAPPVYDVGERLHVCSPFGSWDGTVSKPERFGYVTVRRDEDGSEQSFPLQHVRRIKPKLAG